MENIYLYMIVALAFLAVADLVVGISNDAVNFLIKALEDTGNNTHNVGCGVIATARQIIDSCIKVTAGSYPVVQNRCDEIELGEDTRFRLVAKYINITCLDVITKSTWNWIKKVKNLP